MNTEELFQHWGSVREGLCQALDCLSEAQLDFTPRTGLWSLRETVCHIAEAEEGWFRHAAARELKDWPHFAAADYPTISSLKTLLADVHARTEQYFAVENWAAANEMVRRKIDLPWGGTTSLGWIVWHVLEHEIHHRGEVFLMLGLMGIEAPDV